MRFMVLSLSMLLIMSTGASADGMPEKARLQAAMQQHIQRHLINGAILHLDSETGDVSPLYPTKAHPMVIAMGNHYVLCTDLQDRSGNTLPLDLYMAPNGQSFTVFQAEIGNRAPLMKLMKSGLAKPVR